MDEILQRCTETELLEIARRQGIGRLRRGIERGILIQIVSGETIPEPIHFSPTIFTRHKLEIFIEKNWGIVGNQIIPLGCGGKCRTFHCTDAKHSECLLPNKDLVLNEG